jgi:putative transposase
MARRKVQFASGGFYHLYNRGANRTSIFHDDDDYLYVLRAMKRYSRQYGLSVIAYCLMPNHFHWLVYQEGDISARLLPQRVFNGYVKAFNRRHQRSGTLFEGPFRATHVDNDAYLHHLCLYIHANPVKDGFAAAAELWPYSNCAEWISVRQGTLFQPTFVAAHFGGAEQYRTRMAEFLREGGHLHLSFGG